MDVARRALERYFPNSRRPPPVSGLRSSGSTLDDLAVSVRCRRGDLISSPGHSRQYWFKIISGAAKRFSIHSDGRRQIVDLLLPGDFVGIGRDADLEFTVEAMTDGTVLARFPAMSLKLSRVQSPPLRWNYAGLLFQRFRDWKRNSSFFGRITAVERSEPFCLIWRNVWWTRSCRAWRCPCHGTTWPNSSRFSVETVSRALSELKYRGLIRFAGTRQITDRRPRSARAPARS